MGKYQPSDEELQEILDALHMASGMWNDETGYQFNWGKMMERVPDHIKEKMENMKRKVMENDEQ